MKRTFNIVEGFYSDFGHYVDDVIKYADVYDDYCVVYYVNGAVSQENKARLCNVSVVEFNCGHSILGQFRFLYKVMRCMDKDGFNFVASVNYISLALFIMVSGFKNLYLLIHFFPTVHKLIYRFFFRIFLKKINSFVVFSESVKQDIISNIGSCDIAVINARDIDDCLGKRSDEVLTVSFIGAMNATKDIGLLINVLVNNKIENVRFRILSSGVADWCDGKIFSSSVEVIDGYFDNETYNNYLKESDFVFLSYKECYGVRFSAMVIDALNNGCGLICNQNKSFDFLKEHNVGYFFDSEDELKKVLSNLERVEIPDSLKEKYSKKIRVKKLKKLLHSYFINRKVR